MKYAVGVLVLIGVLVVRASVMFAQTPADPSGHWEGAITAPFGEVEFELDVTRQATGELAATYSRAAQGLRHIPLSNVVIDGRSITFELKANGGGVFMGILYADGKTMSGDFTAPIGTAPFSLTRTGDAVVAAPLTGPAISKELEGTWSGTLNVEGQALRLQLKMANQPDGRSTATIVSLDQGNLEIPVGVRQSGTEVTVDVRVNGGVYAAALNAAGTELAGTYNVQGLTLPLTLRQGSR